MTSQCINFKQNDGQPAHTVRKNHEKEAYSHFDIFGVSWRRESCGLDDAEQLRIRNCDNYETEM